MNKTTKSRPLVSVIIPVFNEQNTLQKVISQVQTYIKQVKTRQGKPLNTKDYEVILVNDGSTDNTAKIAKNYQSKSNFQVFNFQKNRGKGFALRHGIKQAKGKFLIVQDADLEYHPKYFATVLKPLIQSQAQVVYGSRLSKLPLNLQNLSTIRMPLHFIANKFLSWFTNLLYRSQLTDMETGYKAVSADVIKPLNLVSTGFEIEVELTAKILQQNVTILEVPITTEPRNYQEGKKITALDGLKAVFYLLKYRFSYYHYAYPAIFIIALFTRFYNFTHRYALWADQSRDALVGQVALAKLSPPLIGSFSSAGPFTFGPFWYYYSMLTAFLFDSHLGYWLLITFFSALTVPLFIWLGHHLAGPKLGLIAGLLAAISPEHISSALAATQHSAVNITITLLFVVYFRFHQTKANTHLYLIGLILGLAINFHYQAIYLLPLFLVLIFLYQLNLESIWHLARGFILPFIPLLLFDLYHHWWNAKAIYQYLTVDQYNIYVPNRWLTYTFDYWPQLWSSLVGGLPPIGMFLMSATAILLVVRYFQNRLDKRLIVLGYTFLFAVIWYRYFRGLRFTGYVNFFFPFIIFFSSWLLYFLYQKHRLLGLTIIAITVLGSYLRFIDHSQPTNLHSSIQQVADSLPVQFPNRKFTIYDYGFHTPECSISLSLFLSHQNLDSEVGLPIGVCPAKSCPPQTSTLAIIPTQNSFCQVVSIMTQEPLQSTDWVQVSPQAIHHDTVVWWQK